MCLIPSTFLEEEFVQTCTIFKMSRKVFTCISAISEIACKECCAIGHPHDTLVLLVCRVTPTYAEAF